MTALRIGIVGIGGMGRSHARYLTAGEVSGAELTAVCDTSAENLEIARETWGDSLQRFDNMDKFLDAGAVDAVLIATPHYFHPQLACQVFAAGLHVLTEKPAGVYTKQVRELNRAAAKSGKVFAIMFNFRTHARFQKLKDLVASGELGELKRTNWIVTTCYRSQSYYDSGGWRATWAGEGGGVLLNQCPHQLDLWQWIAGMPKRVRAFCSFGKYHDLEVEDDVTAYVEYENGATGLFIASTGEAPGTDRLEITGDRGKVILEDGKITFYRTRVPVSQFTRDYEQGFGVPESWTCEIPPGPAGSHRQLTQNWVEAIQNGSRLLAPGEEGLNSLMLSNAMLLSSWTDGWVELPLDDDLYYEKLQEKIETSTFKKK